VSYLILFLMDFVPFLKLRVSEADELEGLDRTQIGEYAFEALSEKEAACSLGGLMGDVVEDGHGGMRSV
jgi:hypothetical protein